MVKTRIGIWLIGAKGGVASTAIVGLIALKKGLAGNAGLVTDLPPFADLDLAGWDEFVVGGHEIRDVGLADEAMRWPPRAGPSRPTLVAQCRGELDADRRAGSGRARSSTWARRSPSWPTRTCPARNRPAQAVDAAAARLGRVRRRREARARDRGQRGLDRAAGRPAGCRRRGPNWSGCSTSRGRCPLPASSLYAIAALDLGCSYINFTPSLGSAPAAIDELARLRGTRHMGCDGKTGETLLKSVLAPMFAQRNLQVMSWVGHNIFGNMDGQVLDDPANKQAKVASKDHLLGEILGYQPQTLVSIEYIESLGDWKTAWDHIHFAGFLGTPMTLQFIWQGCDSLLAAPLVLDLVRFTELARAPRRRRADAVPGQLLQEPLRRRASSRFDRQFQMLEEWATENGS